MCVKWTGVTSSFVVALGDVTYAHRVCEMARCISCVYFALAEGMHFNHHKRLPSHKHVGPFLCLSGSIDRQLRGDFGGVRPLQRRATRGNHAGAAGGRIDPCSHIPGGNGSPVPDR